MAQSPRMQLRATVAPGQAVAPQVVNLDGSLSPFSLPGGQMLLLTNVSLQAQSVPAAAERFDVSLVQQTPSAQPASRWAFRGGMAKNVLYNFDEGILFSSDFQVVSGSLSQDTVVVDLWVSVAPLSAFTGAPVALVADVNPGQSVTPQVVNPDGTLAAFAIPAGQQFSLTSISVQRQSAVATPALFDLRLTQPSGPPGATVTRWAFHGTALHNIERPFRGSGVLSFAPAPNASAFSVQSGAQSEDGVVVRLLGYFTPAPESLQELVADVAPGVSAAPQVVNPDGSQSPFPAIPTGQVFRVLSLSVQRQAVSATPALLVLSLAQQVPQGGFTANRWTLVGSVSRNFETTFGMDVGIAFATPFAIENSGGVSEDGAVVRLWGALTPPNAPQSLAPNGFSGLAG